MKIAVYKDNLSTGRGADRAVRNFAAGLAERGHDVAIMEKREFAKRVLFPCNGRDDPLVEGFDVIVATGSNEIVDMDAAGYFIRPNRAKVVLQLHLAPRGFFKWRHPLRNRRIRAAFGKPDAVQVLCSSYETEFCRIASGPRLFTIGNYAAPFPGSAASGPRRPVVLYPAATLNGVKNQKLLIAAFASVAADFPEWKVRLLGKDSTSYAASCRRMISRKGLADRIEIAGFTDDLASEYAQAEFIAFPSTLEGFPLAILEAAQYGLPAVVQSGLPGVADIVRNGETGIVADSGICAYAEGLRSMISDSALRRRLGENARVRCGELYSRDRVLDRWETLLATVAGPAVA